MKNTPPCRYTRSVLAWLILSFNLCLLNAFAVTGAGYVGNPTSASFDVGYYSSCGGNYTYLFTMSPYSSTSTTQYFPAPVGSIIAFNQVPVSNPLVYGGNNVYFGQTFGNVTLSGFSNSGRPLSCSGQWSPSFTSGGVLQVSIYAAYAPQSSNITAIISSPSSGTTITNYTTQPTNTVTLNVAITDLNIGAMVTATFYDGTVPLNNQSFVIPALNNGASQTNTSIKYVAGNLSGGVHVFSVQAIDALGGSVTTSNITVTVLSVTRPTVSLSGTSPNGITTNVSLQASATSNDPGFPIVSYAFWVSSGWGGIWQTTVANGAWSPTNIFGTVRIYATASDSEGIIGYSTTNTYTIVPSLAPNVYLTSPSALAVVSPTTNSISGYANNTSGNLLTISIFTNGVFASSIQQTPVKSLSYYIMQAGSSAANGRFDYQSAYSSTTYYVNPDNNASLQQNSYNGAGYLYAGGQNLYMTYNFPSSQNWTIYGIGTLPVPLSSSITNYTAYYNVSVPLCVGSNSITVSAQSDGYTGFSGTNLVLADVPPGNISIVPLSSSFTNVSSIPVQITAGVMAPPATYTIYDGGYVINNNSTGNFIWSNPTLGTHQLWAKVVDAYGLTGKSLTNAITFVTNHIPTVVLLSPTNGFNGLITVPVTVAGSATNADGHAVTVFIYTNNVFAVTSSVVGGRFTNSIYFPAGTNSFFAVVQGDGFNQYSATNTIGIEGPPSAVWVAPSSATYAWSFITNLQAVPSDPLNLTNGLSVYYSDGATLLGKATVTSSFSLPRTNLFTTGIHSLIASITNAAGLSSRNTNAIVILADRAPTNVVLSSPTTSTNVPGAIYLQATAIDLDGDPITMVFYDGPNPIATNTASPFTNTVSLMSGVHSIHATAFSTTFAISTLTNVLILAPTPQWLSPTGQVTQFSLSTLQVTAVGNAPFIVNYTNNGVWVGSSTTASNNYAVTITNSSGGLSLLIAAATDAYGLSGFCTNILTVTCITNDDTKPGQTRSCDTLVGGSCPIHGMAVYSFHAMKASLHVDDTPVVYQPPYGPGVAFSITYNSREEGQPSVVPFSNLGSRWNINCVSYIEDDPENSSAVMRCFIPGGGFDQYAGANQYEPKTGAYLEALASGGYVRHLPDGSSMRYDLSDGATTYPRRFFMTRLTDVLGNALSFNFQSTNNVMQLLSIADASGLISTLQHDSDGHVTSFTDPFGHSAILTYTNGELASITDPAGITSSFRYNGDFLTMLTTPYGQTTFATLVTNGCRTLAATDPLGQTELIQFWPLTLSTGLRAPSGVLIPANTANNVTAYWSKKAYSVGASPKLIQWSTNGASTGFVQDAPAWIQDELGNQTFFNYQNQQAGGGSGSIDKPTITAKRLSDGSSQIETAQYADDGKPTALVDAAGHATTFSYSGIHLSGVSKAGNTLFSVGYGGPGMNLPLTITASGTTIHNEFNAHGQIIKQTDAEANELNYGYDSTGYLQSITGPLGFSMSFTYLNGVLQSSTDESGYTVQYAYDGLNRMTNALYPDNTTEAITFDKLDAVNFQDRQGSNSTAIYDSLRRMISATDPGGLVSGFSYCTCGALEGITDANHHSTSWPLDILGRPTLKGYSDGTYETPVYDPVTSQVLGVTDAARKTKAFGYYANETLAAVSYPGETPAVQYGYDAADRLTTTTDGIGTTTLSYVPEGQPGAGEVASVSGPLPGTAISYAFDSVARPYSVQVNGDTTTVSRDALGRVTNSSSSLGTTTISYDGASTRPLTVTEPAGMTSYYRYTDVNDGKRLQSVEHDGPGGLIMSFRYSYDVLGRIMTITETNSDGVNSWAYDYDGSGRLTAASERGGANHDYAYAYDGAGNRLAEQVDGVTSPETANSVNQITNQSGTCTSFNYDLAGNLTTKVGSAGTWILKWDGADRCSGISGPDSQTGIAYDGLNRWTHITECDTDCTNLLADRWFVWEGTRLVEERDGNGTLVQRFFDNGFWWAGTNYFYIRDPWLNPSSP